MPPRELTNRIVLQIEYRSIAARRCAFVGAPSGSLCNHSERATLDLAWRYTDAGVIETGAGPGRVEWLDGSRDPVGLDLAPTQAPLRSHGLHLSLRYEL